MHPATTFVPSFLKAISDNTEESFRSIMSEPSPGVFAFDMLQPGFCELLISEVIIFFGKLTHHSFRGVPKLSLNLFNLSNMPSRICPNLKPPLVLLL